MSHVLDELYDVWVDAPSEKPLRPHPFFQAARVLCSDGDEDWLELRRRHITASEAAAITGDIEFRGSKVQQARKAREAYNRVISDKVHGSEFVENQAMWFGRMRESANLDIFSMLSGLSCIRSGILYESLTWPFIAATIDGRVVGVDRTPLDECGLPEGWEGLFTEEELDRIESVPNVVVEMKNVRSKYRSQVKDTIPKSRWCQAQVQMLVTGQPLQIVASAVDACELYAKVVYRDREYQERFADAAEKAHKEVMEWLGE